MRRLCFVLLAAASVYAVGCGGTTPTVSQNPESSRSGSSPATGKPVSDDAEIVLVSLSVPNMT